MSLGKRFITFCNENVVMLTGISLIIGIHWGWNKLQNVPYLVAPEEKKELPIIIAAKFAEKVIVDEYHHLTDPVPPESTVEK